MSGARLRRIAIASLLGAVVAYAWWNRGSPQAAVSRPPLPDGVRYRESAWTADDWRRAGYVEMVSPMRPPTSDDGRVHIVVFLRVPSGGLIRASRNDAGWTLELPEGSSADRIELEGDDSPDAVPNGSWRILDVRGIDFQAGGQRFHVLRPTSASGHELLGIEWPHGELQDAATTALGELALHGIIAAPRRSAEREKAAAHLKGLNACPSCHAPRRPERRSTAAPGVVNRGTDASGLFQVASIFEDQLPIETYRPRDTNRGDPLITRLCDGLAVDGGTTRCPNGAILGGKLDVQLGMQRGDIHTRQVCASRRALATHLDVAGREAYRAALSECQERSP